MLKFVQKARLVHFWTTADIVVVNGSPSPTRIRCGGVRWSFPESLNQIKGHLGWGSEPIVFLRLKTTQKARLVHNSWPCCYWWITLTYQDKLWGCQMRLPCEFEPHQRLFRLGEWTNCLFLLLKSKQKARLVHMWTTADTVFVNGSPTPTSIRCGGGVEESDEASLRVWSKSKVI